jgi:uncharacterized protein YbjQ (UPF0145 family)
VGIVSVDAVKSAKVSDSFDHGSRSIVGGEHG